MKKNGLRNGNARFKELSTELQRHLKELKKTHKEHAMSIRDFVILAQRSSRSPKTLALAVEGLKNSVRGFEASYPELASTVEQLSEFFSHIGI